jgi:hypothetical protein
VSHSTRDHREPEQEPEKYVALRRGLRSRRRDDFALNLFREVETSLADPRKVDRLLLELGRCYNPLTNAPIVDLPTRRRIVELLRAGDQDQAGRLLNERLALYARWGSQPGEG